jgi:penicillin amidase
MRRHPGAVCALLAGAAWRAITRRTGSAAAVAARLRGLDGEVGIRRDDAGMPHVFAGTLADLGFGQGYAVAQDRLWQMDSLRHLAGGRLAELLGDRPVPGATPFLPGASLLAVDELYRRLRLYPVAAEEQSLLGAEARSVLEGFTAGVNHRIGQLRPGALPPEHLLLGVEPAPWTVEDSIAVGRLIAWLLSPCFSAKPVLAALGADPALRAFLPPDLDTATCILGNGPPDGAAGLDHLARAALGLSGTGVGSNSWVVAGSRTASGKPLLCNDPHLPLGLPGFWHPIALCGPEHRVIGGSMPGIPMVLIGRNDHLAWGFTAVMADDGDYYRETMDGAGRYRREDGWHPVETVWERFRVRKSAEQVRGLRFVRHGGVLCPLLPEDGQRAPTSFRWTGLQPWPGLDAILGMNRARDVAEFEQAVRAFALPAQNVMVADRAGTIAYFCAGKFPRRAPECVGVPLLDGARGDHAWHGFLEWAEHPRCVDPPEGWLASANNRVSASLPPGLSGGFWEVPYRATRIGSLVARHRRATADDMAGMQADVVSLQAAGIVAAVVRPQASRLASQPARRAAALLAGWDCAMRADSAAAALFHLFYERLLSGCLQPVIEPRVPGLFRRFLSLLHMAMPALDRQLLGQDPRAVFGDGPALVEGALAAAWADATARMGPDPARWQWGRLHTLTFHHGFGRAQHPVARAVAAVLQLNRGPYAMPGDGMTIHLAAYSLAEPFTVVAGSSYRQIVDLGRPEASRWIIAGGASGDPRSPHYADQLPLWLRGEYRPMRFLQDAECGMPRNAECGMRNAE